MFGFGLGRRIRTLVDQQRELVMRDCALTALLHTMRKWDVEPVYAEWRALLRKAKDDTTAALAQNQVAYLAEPPATQEKWRAHLRRKLKVLPPTVVVDVVASTSAGILGRKNLLKAGVDILGDHGSVAVFVDRLFELLGIPDTEDARREKQSMVFFASLSTWHQTATEVLRKYAAE